MGTNTKQIVVNENRKCDMTLHIGGFIGEHKCDRTLIDNHYFHICVCGVEWWYDLNGILHMKTKDVDETIKIHLLVPDWETQL